MNYIVGSAITISCEIPSDKVTGTTLTLESLIDPDGNDLSASEALVFGTGDNANIATVVWQSLSTHLTGKYIYVIKSLNGTRVNYAQDNFYLVEKP